MHHLTPKALAAAFGVSESSIKRWVDDGLLAATRTAGGHRRISKSEAIRFVRTRGGRLARPELLDLPSGTAGEASAVREGQGQRLLDAFVREDAEAARSIILGAYLGGASVAELCDGPIREALTQVGELWRDSDRGILIEHRAVDVCVDALSAIRSGLPVPAANAPLAVGGAPSKDIYIIPTLMVALVLQELGFRTKNLGPDTPVEATLMAADDPNTALVWQAVSSKNAWPGFEHLAASMTESSTPLVAGGQALEAPKRKVPAGVSVMQSMTELAGFARAIREGATGKRSQKTPPR